jgi:hypothetical protein
MRAAKIFLAPANPLLAKDELGVGAKFGLRFADTSNIAAHGTVFDDGSTIAL